MLLHLSKTIFLMLILLSVITAENKEIKKIISDYTEFDRKNNVVNFFGNVKIEYENGWITCDKAIYDQKNGKLNCQTNIFFVYTSTEDYIEVKSSVLEYDTNQKYLKFFENVSALYKILKEEKNNIDFTNINLTSEDFVVDMNKKYIIAQKNVVAVLQGNKILCDLIEYNYGDNVLKINDNITKNQLRLEFMEEKWKIKYCQANTAIVDIDDNKIVLKGKVEIVF